MGHASASTELPTWASPNVLGAYGAREPLYELVRVPETFGPVTLNVDAEKVKQFAYITDDHGPWHFTESRLLEARSGTPPYWPMTSSSSSRWSMTLTRSSACTPKRCSGSTTLFLLVKKSPWRGPTWRGSSGGDKVMSSWRRQPGARTGGPLPPGMGDDAYVP